MTTGCGAGKPRSASAVARDRVAAVADLPQTGPVLGRLAAPATLVIFGRVDDVRLGRLFDKALPALARDFIRSGRVKLQMRTIGDASALGGESTQLAKILQALGLQNRFWGGLASLTARYQGSLAGLSDALIKDVGNVNKAQYAADVVSRRVTHAVEYATELATQQRVRGLAFVLVRGSSQTTLNVKNVVDLPASVAAALR